jgi:hypothetical protein
MHADKEVQLMDVRIKRYRELAQQRMNCDGTDLAAVRAANLAGREMAEIARGIAASDCETIAAFADLLDDEAARGQAAHDLLEVMRVTGSLADRAAEVARLDLDSRIALYGRRFLNAHASADPESLRNAGRRLTGLLGFLLDRCLLSDHSGAWGDGWIDDLAHESAKPLSATSLHLVAIATWGIRSTTREWIAPFEASLDFGEAPDHLGAYCLRFGTKADDGQITRVDCQTLPACLDRLLRERPQKDEEWWFVAKKSS